MKLAWFQTEYPLQNKRSVRTGISPKDLMLGKIKQALMVLLVCLPAACQQKSTPDSPITPPEETKVDQSTVTQMEWTDALFYKEDGSPIPLAKDKLDGSKVSQNLSLSLDIANTPLSLFQGKSTPVSFIGLAIDAAAVLQARYIKRIGGLVQSNQVVTPVECPADYKPPVQLADANIKEIRVLCIPLINAILTNFVQINDSGRVVTHELSLSAQSSGKKATSRALTFDSSLFIPSSSLKASSSAKLADADLAGRLSPLINDKGEAESAWPLFTLTSDKAPGVASSWVFCASSLAEEKPTLTFEEEIFYEQPVVPGSTASKIRIARGSAFRKRTVRLDSNEHFRLRLQMPSGQQFRMPESPSECVTVPIEDGSLPLTVHVVANLQQLRQPSRSLMSLVRPITPYNCPDLESVFNYPSFRVQKATKPEFVACDAIGRNSYETFANRGPKVTAPIESFFGWLNYLGRGTNNALGNTEGIFSFKVVLSGKIAVKVKDPVDGVRESSFSKGFESIASSHSLPTAIDEMDRLLASGKAPSGLALIRTALINQGFDTSKVYLFPFGKTGETRSDVMH